MSWIFVYQTSRNCHNYECNIVLFSLTLPRSGKPYLIFEVNRLSAFLLSLDLQIVLLHLFMMNNLELSEDLPVPATWSLGSMSLSRIQISRPTLILTCTYPDHSWDKCKPGWGKNGQLGKGRKDQGDPQNEQLGKGKRDQGDPQNDQ